MINPGDLVILTKPKIIWCTTCKHKTATMLYGASDAYQNLFLCVNVEQIHIDGASDVHGPYIEYTLLTDKGLGYIDGFEIAMSSIHRFSS